MAGAVTAALFLKRFVPEGHALGAFRHLRLARQRQAGPAEGRRRAGPAGRFSPAVRTLRLIRNRSNPRPVSAAFSTFVPDRYCNNSALTGLLSGHGTRRWREIRNGRRIRWLAGCGP